MKSKVIPTIDNESESIESIESQELSVQNIQKRIYKLIDFDNDGKVELDDIYNNCKVL